VNISSAFIARPIATSLLMAAILLVGAAAYPLLPVAPLPQVDFPIATSWPNTISQVGTASLAGRTQ
jgi:multidrug efflux pump subunit AcrB